MKKFPEHLIFLITATLFCVGTYASPASDSLPACILKMKKKDIFLIVEKYEYKGRRWFAVYKKPDYHERRKKGFIFITQFYDSDCKLVATKQQTLSLNGIPIGYNISPDTVDKTKIINLSYAAYARVQKKVAMDTLPACILIMKKKDSLLTVDEYDYKGEQWFGVYKTMSAEKEIKEMYISTTKFYSSNCKLIATRREGSTGIVRVDDIMPDSIDKDEIIRVPVKVPENIKQLAIDHDALSIIKYEYLGQPLYLLQMELYYDRFHNGTIPLGNNTMIKTV